MFSLVATNPTTNALTQYVFDNIPRVLHEQSGVVTLNPVQDGAPIGDHFYVIPARLTVEILMSDSMQSYTFGQFSDGVARSVSCWQTLKALQAAKAFITISSRLDTYDSMLITDRRGEETVDTAHAGRFTVTFTQVILATVTLTNAPTTDSTRPQATAQTQAGPIAPQVVPPAIQKSFKQLYGTQDTGVQIPVPPTAMPATPPAGYRQIYGGQWSSNIVPTPSPAY
jgi:hypothetical protein